MRVVRQATERITVRVIDVAPTRPWSLVIHGGAGGPGGTGVSAVGTGHLRSIKAPGDGIIARQREVKALVELRVPFELDRQAIDDVERGANDSDWQPTKDAARQIAFAEDRVVYRTRSGF